MKLAVSGIESGPLLLLSDQYPVTELITSFEEFTGGAVQYNQEKHQAAWGIIGSVKDVPPGYRYSVIVVQDVGVREV